MQKCDDEIKYETSK